MTTIDDPNEWGHNTNITKDHSVALVRSAREVAEALSLSIVNDRALIAAQSARIKELEVTEDELCTEANEDALHIDQLQAENNKLINIVAEQAQELKLKPVDDIDVTNAYYEGLKIGTDMHLNALDRSAARGRNVTRLASAALRHIAGGRPQIAAALITPLAQGVHDVYQDDGDTGYSCKPRRWTAGQGDMLDEVFGPMYEHKTSIVQECFADWIEECRKPTKDREGINPFNIEFNDPK